MTIRCVLPLEELYSRALLHFHSSYFNVLLLAAFVHASAMDVVLAERAAPRLLPSLKEVQVSTRGKGNHCWMLLFLVAHTWESARMQDVSMVCAPNLVHKWIVEST